MSWYAYILECADKTFYTGITTDIDRRLQEHQSGQGAKYTRSRTPVKLVYSEKHANRSQASKREWEIKRLPREKKTALLISAAK